MKVTMGGLDSSNSILKSFFSVQPVLVTVIITLVSVIISPCRVSVIEFSIIKTSVHLLEKKWIRYRFQESDFLLNELLKFLASLPD